MNKEEWEDLIALTQAERSAAWSRLDIREWTALGSKLADLKARFRERFPDDGAEPGRPEALPPLRRDVEGETRKWLEQSVASHDPATPYPAEEANWKAAETALSIDIQRDMFRRLRDDIVPKKWLRRVGRPRTAASTQDAPNGSPRGPYLRRK